jgi:hypothetical protein
VSLSSQSEAREKLEEGVEEQERSPEATWTARGEDGTDDVSELAKGLEFW